MWLGISFRDTVFIVLDYVVYGNVEHAHLVEEVWELVVEKLLATYVLYGSYGTLGDEVAKSAFVVDDVELL